MAGNLLMSVSQDEKERAVFRSRRMYQTDLQSDMATAEDRGSRERALFIARNMITDGETVEKITKFTGLTRDEVENLGG